MARRTGDVWCMAGIDADAKPRSLTMALPLVDAGCGVVISVVIGTGAGAREFASAPWTGTPTPAAHGGVVAASRRAMHQGTNSQ